MFGKVFKYEMKAVRRILLPLYGAMILVALLFALSTSLTSDLSAARDGLPVFVQGQHTLQEGKLLCLVAPPCPTLCELMDCSPPGSSVVGIFQARTLEWVAIPFSTGSSLPRD